jgi:predicted AAA+ superfamily ATPase
VFNRTVLEEMEKWAQRNNRKPLILRGARQVGKTTAVEIFSKKFDQYIYLNLDINSDLGLFEKKYSIDELVQAIYFEKNKKTINGRTLIFIDEIQNSANAILMLRYFYESFRDLYVIAAGSLLETLLGRQINFPVGRVEYLFIKPLTFNEFVDASGDNTLSEILYKIPFPDFAHEKMLKYFYKYTLIGGMPEIVSTYYNNQNLIELNPVYESLLRSYIDDVEKYARNDTLARVIRFAIENCFYHAAQRIKFEAFGRSNYKSREISDALRTLEKAMLIYLIYPSTQTELPILADLKKAPRLHIVDTGLVNYFAGLQKELFGTGDLNSAYEGRIAEHIVGQELIAISNSISDKVSFWVKEKKQSNAQVDFIIPYEKYIIPVEVKSGKAGRLRSLHEFIDLASHNYAVRIYSGGLKIDEVQTVKGKKFYLLNLPFYLVGNIKKYLGWFLEEVVKFSG